MSSASVAVIDGASGVSVREVTINSTGAGLIITTSGALVNNATFTGFPIAQTQPAPSIVEPGNISTPEPSTLASPERTPTSTGKREPSPLNKPSEPSVTREQ